MPEAPSDKPIAVFTVGHSTRSPEIFIQILNVHGIQCLVDVRTIPYSRRNPQFNRDTLENLLNSRTIAYLNMKSLGGLRHARKNSPNTGWKNNSFRGYADYMQTREFADGLQKLISLVKENVVCIMCAEAVPWRCHRSMIADALLVQGIEVRHIVDASHVRIHTLSAMARIKGTQITYPGEPGLL